VIARASIAVLFLLLPASASAADVTIGSNLAGTANSTICVGGISCTYIQTSGGTPVAVSPVDGTVVRFRVKAGSFGGAVKLRVLRPSGTSFTAVASSPSVTITTDQNTFPTNIAIKTGDVVALDNASSGIYFTDSPAVALPLVKYFQPAIADGATGTPNNQVVNRELLMNADVTPSVPGAPPPATPTPVLTKLKVKPRTFRAASKGGSIAAKTGATITFTSSTEATVGFKARRAAKGRRRGGKCRKPGRSRSGLRCTRYVRVKGGFTVGGKAGVNSFRFTGRLANRKLRKGRYQLIATPTAGTKRGRVVRA
jgi:hypothetical protein